MASEEEIATVRRRTDVYIFDAFINFHFFIQSDAKQCTGSISHPKS